MKEDSKVVTIQYLFLFVNSSGNSLSSILIFFLRLWGKK